ncbi:MAG: OmpA family protein [Akkermansia sp.]
MDGGKKLEISGHTDDVGSERYNQGLSERRAAAVKAQLIEFGVPAERIVTRGFGKSQPRRTYSTNANDEERDEARKENRRAEMYLDF